MDGLDKEFIKDNMDNSTFIGHIAIAAVKAAITIACIIGSILTISWVNNLSTDIQKYVYISMISGIIAVIVLALQYYYGKLFTLYEIIYTRNIPEDENAINLIIRLIVSVILAITISCIAYFSGSYGQVMLDIVYCSVAATGFMYYIFRKKLVDFNSYVTYAVCGIGTGLAAYGLGHVIIITIGLIGLWVTIGILALEIAFTAVYTYLGLLEWVDATKQEQEKYRQWKLNDQRHEEAKEILGRMR